MWTIKPERKSISMIFDSIAHIESYKGIHPGIYKGLELLRDTDFGANADGTYYVDGDELFYFIQSYETKPANDTPEAHIKYIDIQCILFGAERMDFGMLEEMTEEVLPRPEGDIRFYHGPMDSVTVTEGKFAIFFPGDAHAPGIAPGDPAPVRKVVVKVKA